VLGVEGVPKATNASRPFGSGLVAFVAIFLANLIVQPPDQTHARLMPASSFRASFAHQDQLAYPATQALFAIWWLVSQG
jgi:hypothetical protein